MTLIEHLKTLQYPGRFIVIGKSGGAVFGVYGAMGRSASSLARMYVMDAHNDVRAVATDGLVAEEGNPELLEYRSLMWLDGGFVIANGRQIELVKSVDGPQEDLMAAEPEPDAYLTPRITAVVSGDQAVLYMVRSVHGSTESKRWPLDLVDGKAYFISTYVGVDVRPTPSFAGDPVQIEFVYRSAKDVAREAFDALAPLEGRPDYRVGVFGVLMRAGAEREVAIFNANSTK